MSDPNKGYWHEAALDVIDWPGYKVTVDNQSTLHSLLKAIKKLGFKPHSAKLKHGGWQVWATRK